MRLLLLFIIFSGVVIQTVRSHSLSSEESDSHSIENIRKKRKLDDMDVINHFELDNLPSLHDAFDNLPPFEEENWVDTSSTNFTFPFSSTDKPLNDSSEFKLELSKDEEHVFSGRYRSNSALNWWYRVESYSNVTHYNYTDTESEEDNIIEDRTAVTRSQDDEHVISSVPGVRSGRWSTFDEVVLESPTTPGISVTVPPQVVTPNVTTRYILLQSGRVVAINVTSFPNALKPTPGPSSGYFGSRLRRNNTSTSNIANEINTGTNVRSNNIKPAGISSPNRVTLHSLSELLNLNFTSAATDTPTLIHNNVLTPPSQISRSTIPEWLRNSRGDFSSTNPPILRMYSTPTTTLATNDVRPTVNYEVTRSNSQTLAGDLPDFTNAVTTKSPSPVSRVVYTPPPTVRTTEKFQNWWNEPILTKSPSPRTRTSVFTPSPATRTTAVTEVLKIPEKDRELTIKPRTTLAPDRVSLYPLLPVTILNPTPETAKVTNLVTKNVFETPTTPKSMFIYRSPDRSTTTRVRDRQQITTKKPLSFLSLLPSTTPSTPALTETDTSSGGKPTTQTPPSLSYSLPPKNVIDTIFEVFQPDTSELPFLVVTFDSLKRQSPTIAPSVEVTTRRASSDRAGRLIESNVDYEKVRSTKPSLVSYNYNPYQRTSATSIQESPTTRVLTTALNRNRGPPTLRVTPPVNTNAEKDFKSTESVPKLQRDLIRANTVVIPTKPAIVSSSPLRTRVTTTRHPVYRGRSSITNKPTVASTTALPSSTTTTTTRKPRQNLGFHLRNSISFQTIPPASLSDRRSFSGSTTSPPEVRVSTEEEVKVDRRFHFEPTRRKPARVDRLQNPPTPDVTPSSTIQRARPTTKRVRPTTERTKVTTAKQTVTKEVPSTRSPRRLEERIRYTPNLPPKEISTQGRSIQRQRSQLTTEAEQDKSSSTSTAKPFRVYYFEPKRRKHRKNDTASDAPKKARKRITTERAQVTTSKPPRRGRVDRPNREPRLLKDSPRNREPRLLNDSPRRGQPARSTIPSTTVQSVSSGPDRSRRGRTRVTNLQTTSPDSTLQVTPTSRARIRKPWSNPFIRHQPNVGTTVLATDNQRATAAPSLDRSANNQRTRATRSYRRSRNNQKTTATPSLASLTDDQKATATPSFTRSRSNQRARGMRSFSRSTNNQDATDMSSLAGSTDNQRATATPSFARSRNNQRARATRSSASSTNKRRATATPSLARSTKALPDYAFHLPPEDSFEDVFFKPMEIRRIN